MNKETFLVTAKTLLTIIAIVLLFVLLEITGGSNRDCLFASLFVGCVCIVAFMTFGYYLITWIRTANYQNRRSQNLKLLGATMLLLWSVGWVLYLQALLSFPDPSFVNSELLLRSAVAALDMFMLDIDSAILNKMDAQPYTPYLRGAIIFVGFLSFVCTVGLLISLISARLGAYMKLTHRSRITTEHSHLYLFWGMNRNMELLAKSIRENDSKSIRVFIEKSVNDENNDQEGWSRLLTMLTHRGETFKKVKELDACLALANCRISSLMHIEDVWGETGLNNIKKRINQLKSFRATAELHLFFMSEDEGENIESVGVVRNDKTIKAVAAEGVKVIIYCHARLNSVSGVIEQTSIDTSIEVRIIDSAHLSVEELKMGKNIGLQPVSLARFKDDGTTTSEFNALVVGFNEVGQDIVRFLYEYGAFVSSDQSKGVKRSPFCCHVVDPNMKTIAPHYMDTRLRKGVLKTGENNPLVALDDSASASINLHAFGYKDQAFFDLLNKICDTLNYVVIAVGDDVEGVTLAVWILKHAMRMKKDLRNFKVLLRSYSSDKTTHVDKIVEYYNGLLYAEMVGMAKGKPNQAYKPDGNLIYVFGRAEEIYSFQSIVSNQLRKESWLYFNSYNGVIEKSDKDFAALSDEEKATGKYCSTSEPDYAWNVRRQKELKSRIKGSPKYSQVMAIRRKEAQDMENAMHRHTKRYVALKALGDEMALRGIAIGIRNHTIVRNELNEYIGNQQDNRQLNKLMTTLAQMEHLRWVASHQILGYVWGAEKNEAYSEHDCLVEWNSLASDEIRSYDYDVVDCSFRLDDEEIEEKEKGKKQ